MSLSSNKSVFELLEQTPCEQLNFFLLPKSGLKLIIAVHNTNLGPSLGGCRIRNYDCESAAIDDVIRLAEGMTYKNALARLPLGGGKAVLWSEPDFTINRELAFLEVGECIDRLGGSYITAQDMGTTDSDIATIRKNSKWVSGYAQQAGGSGNPSPWTALGVFTAIKTLAGLIIKAESLTDLKILVEGAGGVGENLLKHLVAAGARPIVVEKNQEKCEKLHAEFADAITIFYPKSDEDDSWLDLDFSVYSPCAVGQSVNNKSAQRLNCSFIAGAANNQLSDKEIQKVLAERNIFYAPDYVVNAGGVISIGGEYQPSGWREDWVCKKISAIGDTLTKIYSRVLDRNSWPDTVANELAKEIIEEGL
jgi:leucine dehydrogenase